jgi:amidase
MEIKYRSATELAVMVSERKVSSRDLLEHFLQRTDRFNADINAIVYRCDESARKRADEADRAIVRGEHWGPLHGIPMTVKDNYDVVGMPASHGAPWFAANYQPRSNATAVQSLVDNGALVFGKTNMPPWGQDWQTFNDVHGVTNNPWDVTRTPGGSSGGSAAALAAGLTPIELGGDVAGSIRIPAHFCGVYSHKPSWGIVPQNGKIPKLPVQPFLTQDLTKDIAVAGPLAISADDLELMMDIIVGPGEFDQAVRRFEIPKARHERLQDFKVGLWLDDDYAPVDSESAHLLHSAADALKKAGAQIKDRRPDIDLEEAHEVYYAMMAGQYASRSYTDVDTLTRSVADLDFDEKSHAAMYARFAVLSHAEYLDWNDKRLLLRRKWATFFEDCDILLCPVSVCPAFKHNLQVSGLFTHTLHTDGSTRPYADLCIWPGLVGAVLLPSTIAPVGTTSSGLPIGIQIVAPFLEDRTSIRFAQLMADVVGGVQPPKGF